jgi:hypothetical protein
VRSTLTHASVILPRIAVWKSLSHFAQAEIQKKSLTKQQAQCGFGLCYQEFIPTATLSAAGPVPYLRGALRCQEESMLLSVHGAYSNNLSRDIYRSGPLQFPN